MKEKIHILGEDIEIAFNMSVQIAYEEIADKPFNVDDFASQKSCLALYMAVIIANNPDTKITVEKLMKSATGPEITELSKATTTAMYEWLKIPTVMQDEKPADDAENADGDDGDEEQNEKKKNA